MCTEKCNNLQKLTSAYNHIETLKFIWDNIVLEAGDALALYLGMDKIV